MIDDLLYFDFEGYEGYDDLLDFEESDDLLDFEEDDDDLLELDEFKSTKEDTHSFVLAGESNNPNDYISEVKQWVRKGINPPCFGDAFPADEAFKFWLDKYNKKSSDSLPVSFLAGVAIHKVQYMRANAAHLSVSVEGKIKNYEVILCDDSKRKVQLACLDESENRVAIWFNLDTGKVLDSKYNMFSLT